jgi:putative ABC transport system permease protein
MHALVLTIAAVSLALGGLGVANMMVISVTERTREIGIRKALGAEPRTIYWQVLLEACTVLTLGGVLGVILAAITCSAIGALPLTETYAVHLTLNWWVVLTCLVALAAVCLLAGTIPARRAAALPPVEALRWA